MIWLLHDLLLDASSRHPERTCLVYRGDSLSYRQVEEYARKLASLLVNAGLKPGDRVSIYLEKSFEEAVGILAVSLAGGIFIDVNGLLKAPQVRHILSDSGASILVTSVPRLRNIGKDLFHLPNLHTVIACGTLFGGQNLIPDGVRLINMQDAVGATSLLSAPVSRIDSDPAAIIYTSGSTGMPKGVVFSHRNLVAGAKSVYAYLHKSEQDRILSILPFSFDYGLNQLTTSLLAGATLVLRNYLTAHDILGTLEQERITGLAGVPTIWSQLLQSEWSGERFPCLRYITNSGGTFPEKMVKEYTRRLPRTQIYLMYGLTEAFRSTYLEPSQLQGRPTSIGKAIPNAEILVLDEQGRPCPPGQIGQLVHRGVHVTLGYWNDPERTRERFRPNPLQPEQLQTDELVVFSGDLVRMDDEGYLYYVGRTDEMIKSSGFRISPTEVEEHFYSTGIVQDAVAVGVPHEILGESTRVVLSLRERESITPDRLLALASKNMPSYMIPNEVRIVEEIPKNSNGKIDRASIRRRERDGKTFS